VTSSARSDLVERAAAPVAAAAAGPAGPGAVAGPTPAAAPWARPDDAVRQAQLDAMKRRATGLLALAAALFGGASVLESRYPWLGYLRATAEASLVGGLADWFAVTALFRRPLGLPIPHTAIVATRKERIGRILGSFVQNHFLSREVIAAKLEAMDVAGRAAHWLSQPENGRRVAQQVASGIAKTLEALPDEEMRSLVHQVVTARLRATRVAPALGKTLSLVLAGSGQQELLNEAVHLAAQAVHDNRDLIREQVRRESPWWVPGVVDDKIYERIVAAIERLLRDMAADPGHPLRTAFDAALRDFVHRLEHAPEVIARAEALKEEWLAEPGAAELSARLWETTRRAIVAYATRPGGAAPGPLAQGISSFGAALADNAAVLAEINARVTDVTVALVEQYRQEIGDFIAHTVAGWDPAATSRRFELAVGRDLQFVRINGTLVGGLVGLAIYTIWQLWH
jgi:uncharacterized membrane-anchored protein YjiN (DUF445 family)